MAVTANAQNNNEVALTAQRNDMNCEDFKDPGSCLAADASFYNTDFQAAFTAAVARRVTIPFDNGRCCWNLVNSSI